MRQRLTGLLAVVTLLALLAGLPWVLLTLGWGNLPTGWEGWQLLFTRPDDGTLLIGLVKIAGLVCWLILAVAILVELVAALRGVQAPQLRGIGWMQLPVRQLVVAAALLFVVPSVVSSVSYAHAEPPAPHEIATPSEHQHGLRQAPAGKVPTTKVAAKQPLRSHTVQPGESLWSIAEDLLGSGERYPELVALNKKLVGAEPDLIQPGWKLKVPAAGQPASTTTEVTKPAGYVVEAGDTLSSIAERHLGDADRYDEIFRASRHIKQPGGQRLVDPDVIDVGWRLTIPTNTAAPAGTLSSEADKRPERIPQQPTTAPQAPSASPSVPTATTAGTHTPTAAPQSASSQQDEAEGAPWLLTGLVGAGLVLGGSMSVLLRRRRQAQFRARRPGRAIAAPPAIVAPVEKTIITEGSDAAPTVAAVDYALRSLAADMTRTQQPMPQLRCLQLRAGAIVLHLAEPADLPGPWQPSQDPDRWTLPVGVDLPAAGATSAPYPQLASLGEDDQGDLWLANLEQLGVLSLSGDTTHSIDFARYLVAEMATNPWASMVHVDCFGIAADAAVLNPARIRHHDDQACIEERVADAVGMVDRSRAAQVDVATGRAGDVDDNVWPSWLVVAGTRPSEPLQQLITLASAHRGYTGTTVLILLDAASDTGATQMRFTSQGRLQIPQWNLDLIPVGLTSDEAEGCAALLAACDEPDTAMPVDAASDGWREYATAAGSVRNDLVVPRDVPAGQLLEPASTVLGDEGNDDLLEVTATTAEDLAELDPWVPTRIRDQVEAADPALDADLADWLSPSPSRPRLWLLGPITARCAAGGNPTAAARRRAFYTELWAYLALRPNGATTDETADAFNLDATQIRKHMGVLRDWLGKDGAGNKHLPDAKESKAAKARGVGVYQLHNVLVDIDLFRRLRVRGQARGPEGLDDLRTALSLVTGEPFSGQRGRGWAWLVDGDRIDHHMVCSIIDVAHLVVTAELRAGHLAQARAAAEIAVRAAPYDDQPRLDLAAVEAAEGNHAEAARIVDQQVTNRTDNPDEAPHDLSDRAAEVAQRAPWLNRGQVA